MVPEGRSLEVGFGSCLECKPTDASNARIQNRPSKPDGSFRQSYMSKRQNRNNEDRNNNIYLYLKQKSMKLKIFDLRSLLTLMLMSFMFAAAAQTTVTDCSSG